MDTIKLCELINFTKQIKISNVRDILNMQI